MKNISLYALACTIFMISMNFIDAAEKELDSLPLLVSEKLQSEKKESVGRNVLTALILPTIPTPRRDFTDSRPEKLLLLASESVSERLPRSLILSSTGSKVIESSPRLAHAGVRLIPLGSSPSFPMKNIAK